MPLRPVFLSLCTALLVISAALAAEPPKKPQIVFVISEGEYDTKTTLPAFSKAELEPRGIACTFSIASADRPDDFPGLEALKSADLLFVSVRRQAPTEEQMALIHAHVAAGKAVAGIRTASHAFAPPPGKTPPPARPGHAYWPEFDHEVLGGNYNNHYGVGITTFAKIIPEAADHPVLAGIGPEEFMVASHLYKNPSLPASDTTLMTGRMENRPEVEPVAWVNTANGRRVFYTSLGSPGDFELPQFRRLLRNGIFWALNLQDPAAGAKVPK
jgi:type 1 glutamine amidotransferase